MQSRRDAQADRAGGVLQVRRWQEEQRELATSKGIVRTMLGRERRLPAAMDGKNGAAKGHALRAAINTPIQVCSCCSCLQA